MQVIFLHHSSFLVEADEKVLIFDYFNGDSVSDYHFGGKIPHYTADTPIYMFASHSHSDHFSYDILKMAEEYDNIQYILSEDIDMSSRRLRREGIDPAVLKRVHKVKHSHNYKIDDLKIMTLKSSENGVSSRTNGVAFYVELNGISLFHSGDLADWYWEGIGELMNGRMTRSFRGEIRKLAGRPLNLAFIPMDPRMGEHMGRSMEYVLKETDAQYVFPMHMWQNYEGIGLFVKRLTNRSMAERVMPISRENQVFAFGEE